MSRQLYLVIPVLNEADNVARLLAEVNQHADQLKKEGRSTLPHVVFVDDGSTDGTADLAQAHAGKLVVDVLKHERNYGPGRAFATAFAWLGPRLSDDDLVLTLEGDNTSRLDTAVRLIVRQREGYEIVLASPYAYGGGFQNTSLFRLILSHGATVFVRGLIGVHGLHTLSSFFRLHTGAVLKRLQRTFAPGIIERAGFEGVVEMVMKLSLVRASISEVEMLLDSSRRAGVSKMKVGRTIRGYFSLFWNRRRWCRQVGSQMWRYDANAA